MVQITLNPGATSWASVRMFMIGCTGSMTSGKRVSTTRPSTSLTSTGCPLMPSTPCRTTNPVRLVRKSVSGIPMPSKRSVPSALPVMRAR